MLLQSRSEWQRGTTNRSSCRLLRRRLHQTMDMITDDLKTPFSQLLLSIADDKLIQGHRASDWTGVAPILEEDIAFSAIAQEEIAHAAELYRLVADLTGGNADALAFGRAAEEYRCASIVELVDEFDWATAIARHFFCDHLDGLRFGRLANSCFTPVAGLAARIQAEESVHIEHVDTWVQHLGHGGDDARGRMQQALDALAPHASMMFEATQGGELVESAGLFPKADADMFDQWLTGLKKITGQAGLTLNVTRPAPDAVGGRRGQRSGDFAELLDEMSEVYRQEPEAAW